MRQQLKTKSLCLSSPADKASVNSSRLEWEEEMVHERKMEDKEATFSSKRITFLSEVQQNRLNQMQTNSCFHQWRTF